MELSIADYWEESEMDKCIASDVSRKKGYKNKHLVAVCNYRTGRLRFVLYVNRVEVEEYKTLDLAIAGFNNV